MRVEMTFNDAAITAAGYRKEDIYWTIKKAFTGRGLRCTSENELLSFEDNGGENDYAQMWNVLLGLVQADWFVRCTASCVFFDEDTEEDVLCQAAEIRKMLA